MGVLVKLISELNSALRRHLHCGVSRCAGSVLVLPDYAYIVADKVSSRTAAPARCRKTAIREYGSSTVLRDGPVPFRYPAGDYRDDLLGIGS